MTEQKLHWLFYIFHKPKENIKEVIFLYDECTSC